MRPFHPQLGVRVFTLIELLVVITIVAILASMLLPALKNAKDSAKSAKCLGNEKQIGIMCSQYADEFGDYLPAGYWDTAAVGGNWDASLWNVWLSKLYTSTPLPTYQDKKILGTVFDCPGRPPTMWLGGNYGFNVQLPLPFVSTYPDYTFTHVRTGQVVDPAKVRLVADCASYFIWVNSDPCEVRHVGRRTNLLYADFHAASLTETEYRRTRGKSQ